MNRISSTSYFDQTISNVQSSYAKLLKLQNQVQTQKAMERPSDDPVRSNQALLLESNLKEIQQYQKNVATGSDLLTYSDQILDSLMVPLNNVIEKTQQGLNAEQDATSRAAIAAELEAILDTLITVGNTQLADKNIFGGSQTSGEVFTRLGGDILFNGNNDDYNIGISQGEQIKANITANDIFGSSSTILDSEHNLNAKLSELSLEASLPISKAINTTSLKITGRTTALNALEKAGIAKTDTKYTSLSTQMDAISTASYNTFGEYSDAVRTAASTAIKGAASTGTDLNETESYQVKQVVDAARAHYLAESSSLTLQSGEHLDTSRLTVTFSSSTTTNVSSSVNAINKALVQAAGTNNANVALQGKIEALAAYKKEADRLGVTTLAAMTTNMETVRTGVTATTNSEKYAYDVKDAAIKALGKVNGFSDYGTLTTNEKLLVDATVRAAKNTFAATEFKADITRSGLNIRHDNSEQISIDEGSSDARLVNAFQLDGKNNSGSFISEFSLKGGVSTLAADRVLTLTTPTAKFVNVQLRQGDTVEVVARRINTAVNQMGIDADLRGIVASVDSSDTNKQLVLSSSKMFKLSMNDTTEIDSANAVAYNTIKGQYRPIEDLRGGNGLKTGTHKIMADNLTTGFANAVTVMEGDSLEYLVQQLNDLAGFDASLNSDLTGIKLSNTTKYAVEIGNPATNLIIANSNKGINTTVTFSAAATTLSQKAEEINAKSSTSHQFHAEVNNAGTGLIITSNEAFTLSGGATKSSTEVSDLSALSLIDSDFLSSLGLNRTADSDGVIEGENILSRQVRLSELNGGRGVRNGRLRITIGNTVSDINLTSAATLRDVKVIIEETMPGMIKVGLNDSGNGLSLTSKNGSSMRIEELDGGAVARTLGLIKAPAVSATGVEIEGGDIDPILSGKSLIKDLNGGQGIDTTGFVITNGEYSTTITMDSDGDGVDDIRTIEELVNHINQKAKQDQVYVQAEFDPKKGGLKITSKLANTSMKIVEKTAANSNFKIAGVKSSTTASTLTISNADKSQSINVSIAANATADAIVTAINTEAAKITTNFAFRAILNDVGTVDILSQEGISASDTLNTSYSAQTYTPTPPVMGKTAADLGLLGSFSNSTLLSTLNGGAGIENGTFKIKYGSTSNSRFTFSNAIASTSTAALTFYNENASSSVTVANPSSITAAETTNLSNLGITFSTNTTTAQTTFTSTKRYSVTQAGANLAITATNTAFPSTAKEVTVDVEFAETLGEVKAAIETATNKDILVSFSPSNRIELTLASGDESQRIEISEMGGTLATATTLGLIHPNSAYGRDLRDGTIEQLNNATLLSDLGLNLQPITSNSGVNDLVINTSNGIVTLDMSHARTVGDVITTINGSTITDSGKAISLEAKVENGKFISITDLNSNPIEVVSSSYSTIAEKLGFVPDPELVGESHFQSRDLKPHHQAENFFSAVTTLRDQFQRGVIDNSTVSNTLTRLEHLQNKFLAARGDAGGRIYRFETIQTRYEDEAVFIEGLYGEKTGIDVIEVTQKYLAQQQVYESGLSVASRILGTSLFSYI